MVDNDVAGPAELGQLTPDLVADARGVACPGPLLEARRAIARLPVGAVLEVLSSDSQTRNDVAAWAAKVGHGYLGHLPGDGYDRVFLRKGR